MSASNHRRSSVINESKDTLNTSRRSFLKFTGLAAGAVITPGAKNLEADAPTIAQHASTKDARAASPVTLVNILQGTDSTPAFSRGNTLPIAARPFGMAHWTLQSTPNTPWMFQPGQRRIQAFRSTHQLSPWLSDYGHATFLPICGLQTWTTVRAPRRIALRIPFCRPTRWR
jgi:hypothetical protein